MKEVSKQNVEKLLNAFNSLKRDSALQNSYDSKRIKNEMENLNHMKSSFSNKERIINDLKQSLGELIKIDSVSFDSQNKSMEAYVEPECRHVQIRIVEDIITGVPRK